ncbi:MAG: HlyD family efflux transporter periplasmic adaptor subunit [Planctomycetota bacterium]|nr:HlyD family efflux transporter periplasmic adaptor subunit [Planctomycetota bacterium]
MSGLSCRVVSVVLFFVFAAAAPAVVAQEEASAAGDAPGSKKPKTHEVSSAPFKVEVTADGMFEAAEVVEVSIQPEVWTAYKVLEAVEEGKQVKKGDVLVSFDARKIEEEITDLQAQRKLTNLELSLAERGLEFLQLIQPLDLEAAQRTNRIAAEDLKRFTEIDRALSERSVQESRKSAGYRVEYAEEELNQLEQMYKADDLTEETEEIILKRAQRSVESARFWRERSNITSDKTLELDLPRRAERLSSEARRKALNLGKAEETFPMELAKKKLGLEKKIYDLKKSTERLGKLQSDLEQMVVRSPADGVVYYGRSVRGNWTGGEAMAKQLRKGGSISSLQVFMSIVQPRPMSVRVKLPEKDLRYLSSGVQGRVVPTAYPDTRLTGTLKHITPIPVKAGTFDATVEVELGEEANGLIPGMACSVKLVPYQAADALAIPSSSVFRDEVDDEKRYVYLVTGDGKHMKQAVVLGKHSEENVEVLEGLKEGDEILLEKPK